MLKVPVLNQKGKAHICWMSTLEQWTEILRCPHCESEGSTTLSQLEGSFDVMVEKISEGFEAVQFEYGVNFRCAPCGIPVRK